MYTIGRLAQRAKVNADSIRFYERQGLLTPATKTDSGYRLYTDEALRRIAFIKLAQRCGFSLAEIADLLQMHSGDPSLRSDAYCLAAEKQTEIRKTIDSLEVMSAALTSVLASRADNRPANAVEYDESPLLKALEGSLSPKRPAAATQSERAFAMARGEQRDVAPFMRGAPTPCEGSSGGSRGVAARCAQQRQLRAAVVVDTASAAFAGYVLGLGGGARVLRRLYFGVRRLLDRR